MNLSDKLWYMLCYAPDKEEDLPAYAKECSKQLIEWLTEFMEGGGRIG